MQRQSEIPIPIRERGLIKFCLWAIIIVYNILLVGFFL